MLRLFVALRPPPPIRAALADSMAGISAARWQDDDQLHVTVRYIGEVDEAVGEDVALVLGSVRAPQIEVRLASVGRFEKRGATTALWAGLTPQDGLAALHRKVDRALATIGLAPEGRAYLPHVTLARLARGAGAETALAAWLARHAGLSSVPFALSHLVLYHSRLHPDGAAYEAIARWPLD